MINLIAAQLMYKISPFENNDQWSANSRAWDFFRVEYKNCAREAYEYWMKTQKLDWDRS